MRSGVLSMLKATFRCADRQRRLVATVCLLGLAAAGWRELGRSTTPAPENPLVADEFGELDFLEIADVPSATVGGPLENTGLQAPRPRLAHAIRGPGDGHGIHRAHLEWPAEEVRHEIEPAAAEAADSAVWLTGKIEIDD